jgi:alkylation response protein AidB-like acyl-CoA dehydrogenase
MATSRDIHADHESAVAAARALVPVLRERAEETEKQRMVPEQTIEDLRATGLLHLFAPRAFGGSQLGITTFVETAAEIASGCGSTGWVFDVLAGHHWTLSLLSIEAQTEVYADPNALVASVIHMSSKSTRRVADGYLIEGASGRFCSGVDHASWILAGSEVVTDDGHREPYYFLIPRSEFTIIDDWYAAGLSGTGSKSVSAARIFVPDHRGCPLTALVDLTAPGIAHHDVPLYRLPFRETQRLQLLGATLGIARAALDRYTDIVTQHHAVPGRDQLAASHNAFLRLARVSVEFDSAVNLVLSDTQMLDALPDSAALSASDRKRCMRDIAFAAQTCRRVVNDLFEASGARGLLTENPLQRLWRDANAAAAHVAFVRDSVDLTYGRALCGLED